MSEVELRKVLLRVVFDGEFSNLLRSKPKKALIGYPLTDDEKAMLASPTIDLLDKVRSTTEGLPWPVWIFILPTVSSKTTTMTEADKEKVTQLVRDIRNSVDQERFDLIMDLVQQVRLED